MSLPPPAPIMTEEQAVAFELDQQYKAIDNALAFINKVRAEKGERVLYLEEVPKQ
jgi:hypothetical protein